jgi:fermentation-respiration switch protein FrsA (DUF1100 family)
MGPVLLRLFLLVGVALAPAGCLSSFIYFPDPEIRAVPEQVGLSSRWVSFPARDGVRLSAWYVPRDGDRGVVLFLHGNGGNVSHYIPALAMFHRLGFSSLIVDYRGYGKSQGAPSEQGIYLDAEAAWRYLVETAEVPPERIVVWGRSLGGAIAAWLARGRNARLLVLESTFTSLRDAAEVLYPWAPTGLLVGDRYSTETFLQEVRCPVLVMHSRDDEIIPYALGRRLFERARPPKRFLDLRGRHNATQYDARIADLLEPGRWEE